MSIDFPSFGLSILMPGVFPEMFSPDASAVAAEVPAAEGAVVLDLEAIEAATAVFAFISQFSNFSNVVAPEAETPSETENFKSDSETVVKNDFLDSLAEVFQYTTTTISDFFHPVLEKLGNLANALFGNPMDSDTSEPAATPPTSHTPSHVVTLGALKTFFTGRVGSIFTQPTTFSLLRGCSIKRNY